MPHGGKYVEVHLSCDISRLLHMMNKVHRILRVNLMFAREMRARKTVVAVQMC